MRDVCVALANREADKGIDRAGGRARDSSWLKSLLSQCSSFVSAVFPALSCDGSSLPHPNMVEVGKSTPAFVPTCFPLEKSASQELSRGKVNTMFSLFL